MKRVFLALFVLSVCAGCGNEGQFSLKKSFSKDFTHTGCAQSQKLKAGPDDEELSLLTLEYKDGNLLVTRTNARVNCSVKEYGLLCDVSVDGNVIHYKVYEKDGHSANCVCVVEKISSVVTGLRTGEEYTFDYFCSHAYVPFTFTFDEYLCLVKEEASISPLQ